MAWLREGSCNRCGDCCWGDSGALPGIAGEIEGACPALRCDSEGTFHCSVWGWHPYWLSGCYDWPGPHPATLASCGYSNCGYSYREVE